MANTEEQLADVLSNIIETFRSPLSENCNVAFKALSIKPRSSKDEYILKTVALLCGNNVRYTIRYGTSMIGFTAPMANTKEELANVLSGVLEVLKAPRRKLIGECSSCYKFLTEEDNYLIVDGQFVCSDCSK